MAKPPPTEFPPETTGFIGDAGGWIGWDLNQDRVYTSWPGGWPTQPSSLVVQTNAPLPGPAAHAYDETDFGSPVAVGTPVLIEPTAPTYRFVIAGTDIQVVLRVDADGLKWWSWSPAANAVPIDLPIHAGSTVELVPETQPIQIPAGALLRTATDPLV